MAPRKKREDLMDIPAFLRRKAGKSPAPEEPVEPREERVPEAVELPVDLRYQRVYYVKGSAPKHWTGRYAVKDPPTSGAAFAFVIGKADARRLTVFCPFTLQSCQVPPDAGEIAYGEAEPMTDVRVEALVRIITDKWHSFVRMGFQRDYDVAALVLTRLGAPVPKVSIADAPVAGPEGEEVATTRPPRERKERKGGKPCAAELKKPIDRKSKRGQVADFFLGAEHKSVRECMARLSMTRNSVLSALHVLHKDHGVGYEVLNDTANIIIPPDWDIWS